MQDKKTYLSIGEAAEYLGISIDTLRRWEKRGRVEPLRSPGGHRYYIQEDLDALFGKRYTHDFHQGQIHHVTDITPQPIEIHQIETPREELSQRDHTPRGIPIPATIPIRVENSYRQQLVVEEIRNPVPVEPPAPIMYEQYQKQQADTILIPKLSTTPHETPQRTLVKKPKWRETIRVKGAKKETIQLVIIVAISVVVIICAVVLVVLLWKSSRSVLSPSP